MAAKKELLSPAEKHRLIMQFNQERKKEKKEKTEEDLIKEYEDREQFDSIDLTKGFDKIHLSKKVGPKNENKDLRREIRKQLREKPEAHISPSMWMQLNPSYSMDPNLNKGSTFQDSFCKLGKHPDMNPDKVDKLYHRKRDDHAMFAEALFKNKVLFGSYSRSLCPENSQ